MKYLILPDVHGSTYWETLKNRIKEPDTKIIFLGDYCDSYGTATRQEEIKNLKNIIQFKIDNMDKVVLLLGNHDMNQYILDEPCSRKAPLNDFKEIRDIFMSHRDLFLMVYKIGDYVCSHAGITKTWWNKFKFKDLEDINKHYLEDDETQNSLEPFEWSRSNPWDRYGDSLDQPCTWIRPNSLINDLQFPKQIVGHTKMKLFPNVFTHEELPGVEIYFIDKDIENKHHLELEI